LLPLLLLPLLQLLQALPRILYLQQHTVDI
jgi:hypothetical protein